MNRAHAERIEKYPASPLTVRLDPAEAEAVIQRNELKDATIDTVLRDLEKADASQSRADKTDLYLKVKALVYLYPNTSAQLGSYLKNAKSSSIGFRAVSAALGEVGHEQAQQALILALQDRERHSDDISALSTLMVTLGTVRSPTPQAEEALRQIERQQPHSQICALCELMLGNMARNLVSTAPKRSARLVDDLVEKLRAASTVERSKHLLLALGNAGSPRAMPAMTPFLSHENASLRSTAIGGLRWVPGEAVDNILVEKLSHDPAPVMREEAATAFGFRQVTSITFNAQKKALLSDKSDKVRQNALNNLWSARSEYPEVIPLVRRVAKEDSSKEIRDQAQGLISRHQEDRR
jgi:HEAT repeat protein